MLLHSTLVSGAGGRHLSIIVRMDRLRETAVGVALAARVSAVIG